MNGVPRRFGLLCRIAAADLALRVLGFRRAMRVVGVLTEHSAGHMPDEQLGQRCAAAVVAAAALYPGRALCLEQSLVLYVLLRRRGQPAELRFGVRPYPFRAHAWVELNGVPLNEQPDEIGNLAVFPGKVG
jgi:hypothetical protein